jgi:hypothetical protein
MVPDSIQRKIRLSYDLGTISGTKFGKCAGMSSVDFAPDRNLSRGANAKPESDSPRETGKAVFNAPQCILIILTNPMRNTDYSLSL